MEHTRTPAAEPTPICDFDMLLAEDDAERARRHEAAAPGDDDTAAEPADVFDAQILAGLVSP